jgi:3-deoxy-D-manno-octulosonic-acid transferase
MRGVYVLLTYLLAPVLIAYESWQCLRDPVYRGRVRQRLGLGPALRRPAPLWIHAVSVGEVQAASALVHELRRRDPALPIVMTTVTPTGAARVRALFGDAVIHRYLPYDLPGSVRRFLDRIAPCAAVILETEIWPTLYDALARRDIPLVLGSARLSEKSVSRYRRMPSLLRHALAGRVEIGAQTTLDAERFRAIGAGPDHVHVTGNVKYDLTVPAAQVESGHDLRRHWDPARPVWVAGSTHEGEETAALAAHASVRATRGDALLVLVPRHPQRFESVRELLVRERVPHAQRSRAELPTRDHAVLLVDTLGELQMFYAAADVAFVGGSLVPIGGHSVLEPAVLGLPVISGPYMQNATEAAQLLERAGALRTVRDAGELGHAVREWFDAPDRARAAGAAGREAVAANRGAVTRLLALIEPLLVRASGAPPAATSTRSGSR